MNMEQPTPGAGGRHRLTSSYGTSPDLSLTPRQALANDISDAKSIYQEQGLYTPEMRQNLQQVIEQNKTAWPGTFVSQNPKCFMNNSIQTANKNRKLRNPSEVKAFDQALADYQWSKNSGDLSDLYDLFDDATENHEVMMGIVHLIDTYSERDWVPALVEAIPQMVARESPDWARILIARTINGESSRASLVEELCQSKPDTKAVFIKILKLLAAKNGKQVAANAETVLSALGAAN